MEVTEVFDHLEHTGIYIVDKETLITYYENPVACRYSVVERIGKPCYSIHGNTSMCSSCPIRKENHISFVNRQDHNMIFVVRCHETVWEGHPAYIISVEKQVDLPEFSVDDSLINRMNRALMGTIDVYTEINLKTFEYTHRNLKKAEPFDIASAGNYDEAFEHMCKEEIFAEDVEKVKAILSVENLRRLSADSEGENEFRVQYRLKNTIPMRVMETHVIIMKDELPHYAVCMATDITEESNRNEKIQTLTDILKNVAVGVYVFEVNGDNCKILIANPAVCEIMGVDSNKVIGADSDKVYELTHPDDISLLKNVVEILGKPGGRVDYEYRVKNRKTDSYIWLSAKGRSVEVEKGRVLAYVTYYDITEQKHLLSLQSELEAEKKVTEAKSDFMANMSHEIRTPMNAILGMTSLAMDCVDENQEVSGYLKQIRESSDYLLGIINDILDMSHIDSGKAELHLDWVQPREVITSVIDMITPMMYKKKIDFQYSEDITKVAGFEYYIDLQKTKQMLMNLLNNACKFTDEGGMVSLKFNNIAFDKENHTATDQIIIEDNGCGMSHDFLQRVFLPFEQERTAQTASIKGTGLGLAISRAVARKMGGDITVESEQGRGSRFTVTFEYRYRAISPEKIRVANTHEIEDWKLRGKRILLAEDHPLNAEIAIKLLEKKGVVVNHVSDGESAVKVFAANPPETYAMILMDIRMPIMDGLSATKMIRRMDREDAKRIPIIAMTANAYNEDVQRSLESGMNAHMAKPIEPKTLYETIAKYLTAK